MCLIRERRRLAIRRQAELRYRQALLEIAPSYFEHLASTHNKAVALAKIVGFFSGEYERRTTAIVMADSCSQDQ